jgi:hypothetical protein
MNEERRNRISILSQLDPRQITFNVTSLYREREKESESKMDERFACVHTI